jgi:hypothetical protein
MDLKLIEEHNKRRELIFTRLEAWRKYCNQMGSSASKAGKPDVAGKLQQRSLSLQNALFKFTYGGLAEEDLLELYPTEMASDPELPTHEVVTVECHEGNYYLMDDADNFLQLNSTPGKSTVFGSRGSAVARDDQVPILEIAGQYGLKIDWS